MIDVPSYIEAFLLECLQNYSLDCLVPIFALCSGTQSIDRGRLFANTAKSVQEKERGIRVTLDQIQAT